MLLVIVPLMPLRLGMVGLLPARSTTPAVGRQAARAQRVVIAELQRAPRLRACRRYSYSSRRGPASPDR